MIARTLNRFRLASAAGCGASNQTRHGTSPGRRGRLTGAVTLVVLTFIGLASAPPPAEAHMDGSLSTLAPGMPITSTSLQGLDGKTYPIPSTGPELILFWSIYDGEPLPAMFDMLRKLTPFFGARVRIRAVNLDSKALVRNLPERVKARAAAEALSVPMILDPLRYSRDEFHLKRTPAMVILKDGRIEGFYSFDHAEDAQIVELFLRRLAPAEGRR